MFTIEREIRSEFSSIRKCLQLVSEQEEQVRRIFGQADRVWFVGSGSSYCLAKSAARMFTMRCDIPSFAVAAGDFLLHAQRYEKSFECSVVVFISRSGKTSEVLKTRDIVAGLKGCTTVCICADADAELNLSCDFSLCVPWAFDESVCQTRNIGSFFGCLAMICAIVTDSEALKQELFTVCEMEDELNDRVLPLADQISAWDWDHAVVLADAEVDGLMEEGALAFKEICCVNSNCYNLLDVRHGPMVMISRSSFVFAFLEQGSETELALVKDVAAKTRNVLTFGPLEQGVENVAHFALPGLLDPLACGLAALYIIQNIALFKAIRCGVNPDAPSGLTAWIAL